jgi:hypothetical protein
MTHISLVQAGLGVAIVPESVQKLKWGGVEYRPLDTPGAAMIDLCYLSGELKPTVAPNLAVVRQNGNLASRTG